MPAGDQSLINCWPVIAHFRISRRAYLSPGGETLAPLPDFANDPDELIALYHGMVMTRTFDAKAVALQRTGRLGTYAVALGQEAVAVGLASAMREDDVLLPTYRDNGALLWRGIMPEEILSYWGGDERGSDFSTSRGDFPIAIPVGSQAPHAAGVAYAINLKGEDRVAVCVLGDGAMSKGDVYEAINFAGIHKLPVVYVVNNNQWAISVPGKAQTAAATLAQKAIAAGIDSEQVDGNDAIAVRASVSDAISAARSGCGASLVEAVTYRLGDHTTADDARRYRADGDVQAAWKAEPIARLRNYLVARGAWSKAREEELISDCQQRIDKAVKAYLAMPPRRPVSMFDHLYDKMPASIEGQRAKLEEEFASA